MVFAVVWRKLEEAKVLAAEMWKVWVLLSNLLGFFVLNLTHFSYVLTSDVV